MAIHQDILTIRGEEVVVEVKNIDHRDLKFFVKNPRIYSIVHETDEEPSQDDIEAKMKEMDHVHDLVKRIRRHGGLIEPLIVRKDTSEVIEGNSRLTAYRILFVEDPPKWQKVKCHVLPANIKPSLISSLLGEYHLKGKKGWRPFEDAGFLYRRFYEEKVSVDDLVEESGLKKSEVEHLIATYKFMNDHDDTHAARWSYYFVYLKSKKLEKVRDNYPTFDTVVVDMIKNGDFKAARDVRDKLPLICDGSKKVIVNFLEKKIDFDSAISKVAENKGGIDGQKRLSKFRQWIANPDRFDELASVNGELHTQICFEVRNLHDCLKKLRDRLEKKKS
jgi:hypothetical protein